MNTTETVEQKIKSLYREYVVHEELPVDFQIGIQNFLDALAILLNSEQGAHASVASKDASSNTVD